MGLDPDRLFSDLDLSAGRSLVAAVSGGSDSLALLLLLKDCLDGRSKARLVAVTIDHGLRPEAAAEAAAVAALCHSIGIDHRIMVWKAAKPLTGLIAAAREARYALLAQAAEEFGADTILTGHTMDDQAETVAMRAERGEGGGLSGMARSTLFDDRVWIVRPLLDVRRQTLRDHLARLGRGWIDDPTNENPAYERVRVRMQLAGAGGAEAFAAKAEATGEMRRDLARRAARLIDGYVTRPAPGLFRFDPAIFPAAGGDQAAAIHALRALLAVAGGTPHLPDVERTRLLFGRLGDGSPRATLSRAVIDARKTGVWIRREARGLPVRTPITTSALWDGRWRIVPSARARGLAVAPLGVERARERLSVHPAAPESLVLAALSAEPEIFDAETSFGVAYGSEVATHSVSAAPVVAPYARFLPDFDLPLAAALRRLLDAPPLPVSPLKHHIDERA